MGRLPHAWIAPPETRELRELVRHRAKLVAMRSQCKAHVHAVLAKGGIWVPMTDLFGVEGNLLLDKVTMPAPYKARIASLRRFIEAFDAEIDLFTGLAQRRLTHDVGYTAIQQIPGIGPVLAAVFVAEIGDVHRFPGPAQLTCWAGLTPSHHESDTTVHRGRITKQGSRLVRWAAIELVKILPDTSHIGAIREMVAHRRGNRNIGAVAAARRQLELVFYGLRDHHIRALHHPPRAVGDLIDHSVDEPHLVQHRGGQHERVQVVVAHRAVDHVQRPDSGSHISMMVSKPLGPSAPSLKRRVGRREAKCGGGVQGVADVQVVREGLGPVLGGVHRGIGGDVVVLPARRGALAVVPVQRGLIVGIGVTEQFA